MTVVFFGDSACLSFLGACAHIVPQSATTAADIHNARFISESLAELDLEFDFEVVPQFRLKLADLGISRPSTKQPSLFLHPHLHQAHKAKRRLPPALSTIH
jgi:hypothetical protein